MDDLVRDSQGKETFFYAMDQDDWCCARCDEHGQPGRSRMAAWFEGVLRRLEGMLCHDGSASVLQTRDRQAMLPDGPHLSAQVLRYQATVL